MFMKMYMVNDELVNLEGKKFNIGDEFVTKAYLYDSIDDILTHMNMMFDPTKNPRILYNINLNMVICKVEVLRANIPNDSIYVHDEIKILQVVAKSVYTTYEEGKLVKIGYYNIQYDAKGRVSVIVSDEKYEDCKKYEFQYTKDNMIVYMKTSYGYDYHYIYDDENNLVSSMIYGDNYTEHQEFNYCGNTVTVCVDVDEYVMDDDTDEYDHDQEDYNNTYTYNDEGILVSVETEED